MENLFPTIKDFFPIFWFPHLFGWEEDPSNIGKSFEFSIENGEVLIYSKFNDKKFRCGRLLIRPFSSFQAPTSRSGGKLSIICGSGEFSNPPRYTDFIVAQNDPEFDGATFLIGSSSKATQNADSKTQKLNGISDYAFDPVIGTFGSVATAPAALYRNYVCSDNTDLLKGLPFKKKNGFVVIDENDIEMLKQINFDYRDFTNYSIGIQRNCEVVINRSRESYAKFIVVDEGKRNHVGGNGFRLRPRYMADGRYPAE